MIEGARVHPSYTDAQRAGKVPKSCEDCKASQTVTTRQYMRCAYLPSVDDPTARAWIPPSWRERQSASLDICPGYTTGLPAVEDIVLAHPQWKAGTLTAYLDGAEPTRTALDVVAVYDVGIEEWRGEKSAEAMERGRSGA